MLENNVLETFGVSLGISHRFREDDYTINDDWRLINLKKIVVHPFIKKTLIPSSKFFASYRMESYFRKQILGLWHRVFQNVFVFTANCFCSCTDNHYYMVKYNADGSNIQKFVNTTDLHAHIDQLLPNTKYEFSVKLIKGRRQSFWSMGVRKTTLQAG